MTFKEKLSKERERSLELARKKQEDFEREMAMDDERKRLEKEK